MLWHVFFVVNFGLGLFWFVGNASLAVSGGSGGLYGLASVPPTAVLLVMEWTGWYRRRTWAVEALGAIDLAFAFFAAITTIGVLRTGDAPSVFEYAFVVIATVLAVHFFACGIYRIRLVRQQGSLENLPPLPTSPDE